MSETKPTFLFYVIVLVLGLPTITYAGCQRYLLTHEKEPSTIMMRNNKTIRASFPIRRSLRGFDPHTVLSATEGVLAQNIASPLVTNEDDGQITGSVAESVEWDGSQYIFQIRKYKTQGGFQIDAKAAYYSLMRILMRDSSTHGSLKSFLCPGQQIPDLNATCKGLTVVDDNLILKPVDPNTRQFVLPLLTSIDFGILPKEMIDFSAPAASPIDHKETSGLYYISHMDDETNGITLKINKNHFLYTDNHLETIELVPMVGDDIVENFVQGNIDFIPTISRVIPADLENYKNKLVAHKTKNILLFLLTYTDRGMQRLEQQQRLTLGSIIKSRLVESGFFKNSDSKPAAQFFPDFSEGRLDDEQLNNVKSDMDNYTSKDLLSSFPTIRLAVTSEHQKILEKLFADLPFVKIQTLRAAPWKQPFEEQPDLYFVWTDSGFNEDLALISYNFTSGTFGSAADGDSWLAKYIAEPDKEKRLKALRDLHYNALRSGRFIPIAFEPFYAYSNQKLKLDFSPLYAGTPFWKVTID